MYKSEKKKEKVEIEENDVKENQLFVYSIIYCLTYNIQSMLTLTSVTPWRFNAISATSQLLRTRK